MELTLGERIQVQRKRRNLSQAELARRMHVAKNTLNLIEVGRTKDPRIAQIIAIANELGTHPDYLLGFDDDPRPRPRRKRQRDDAQEEDAA
jgi:transcriptional regulator with XRE-family HTH domain